MKRKNYKELYNKELSKNFELSEDVNFWRSLLILLSLLVISLIFILPGIGKGVDEQQFCQDKLDKYFSEYDFSNVRFYNTIDNEYFCLGDYGEKSYGQRKDGLQEIKDSQTKTKRFELINQEDKDYLDSDDFYMGFRAVGIAGLIIFMIIIITMIEDRL